MTRGFRKKGRGYVVCGPQLYFAYPALSTLAFSSPLATATTETGTARTCVAESSRETVGVCELKS